MTNRIRRLIKCSWGLTVFTTLMGGMHHTCYGDLLGMARTPDVRESVSEKISQSNQSQEFSDAIQAYKQGDPNTCLSKLTAMLATDPTLPNPKLVVIWLLLSDQRIAEAKAQLEVLAAAMPHDVQVVKTLGQIALAEGRLADAGAQLEKAALLKLPANWSTDKHNALAIELLDTLSIVYQKQQRWNDSNSVISRLLTLQPNHPSFRIRMARNYYQSGQLEKIPPLLEYASSKTGGATPVELLWAEIAFASGNYSDTKSRIEKAIEIHSSNTNVQLWHAEFLMFERDWANAKKALERSRILGEYSYRRFMLEGQCNFAQEFYLQAASDFREAVQQLKEFKDDRIRVDAESWLALSLAMIGGEGNDVLAKEMSQNLALANPDNPTLVARLGWIHLREKKFEEARMLLERAIGLAGESLSASHAEIVFFWAQYCVDSGMQAEETNSVKQGKTHELLESLLASKNGMFFFESEARRLLDAAKSK